MSESFSKNTDSDLTPVPVSDAEAPGLAYAQVQWLENGAPFSTTFDDIFFHKEDGLEETRYVFLGCNKLNQRWAALNDAEMAATEFVVAELGFGTGMNILAAVQLWEETVKRSDHRLHLISHEVAPFQKEDLQRALAAWPSLAKQAERLLLLYPPAVRGIHRLHISPTITLTLVFGPAEAFLEKFPYKADCWFLDGFAPSKNESLWNAQMARLVAEHSAPGATFGTYTSAGHVRRGLEAVGFHVQKVKGFAYKKQMSTGVFGGAGTEPSLGRRRRVGSVAVIGGGISGCSTARSFAERGWEVILLESEAELAQGASGNVVGVLMPALTVQPTARMTLSLQAVLYSRQRAMLLEAEGHSVRWNPCGVVRLANHPQISKIVEVAERLKLPPEFFRVLEPTELAEVAGIATPESKAIHFPLLGYLSPRDYCRGLANHPLVQLKTNAKVQQVEQHGFADWCVKTEAGEEFLADVVVVAAGFQTLQLEAFERTRLGRVRGQVLHLPPQESLKSLKVVLCSSGYLTPQHNGMHLFGATYDRQNLGTELDPEELERLAATLPELAPGVTPPTRAEFAGRAGVRCTSPDRMPVVGGHPELAGLYLSTGHGSHGLTSAPLAAEFIASHASGEPLNMDDSVIHALRISR